MKNPEQLSKAKLHHNPPDKSDFSAHRRLMNIKPCTETSRKISIPEYMLLALNPSGVNPLLKRRKQADIFTPHFIPACF